ncbi:precorrin-2 dehydrogenase/sirohydrochlorin ferrochelatase family protein [Desulfolucanica intricata]|uniref:precorrin-2 dehydrogenase/sirohydrochlorin ferrochelatase family protein n=1 Tax=Desulfolucanica intricata TaxID=1285191 RepID=UPI00082EFF1D|nr:bifunctional precorrin-2 dehydrogenase/sirohydrochlorin ferrochelatase [Desulfolucanica intricata]
MERCYPISVRLSGRKCLVIGGGKVAERKVVSLLECGARVTVVSPELTPYLTELSASGQVEYRQGNYETSDLAGAFLVIGATNNDYINRKVAQDCFARNILINVVDDPPNGNFFVPAQVRRGSFSIAISTDGKSPMFARRIREELEKQYPVEYGDVLDLIGELRLKVIKNISEPEQKYDVLKQMTDDEVMQLLREGQYDRAKELVKNAYYRSRSESQDSSG